MLALGAAVAAGAASLAGAPAGGSPPGAGAGAPAVGHAAPAPAADTTVLVSVPFRLEANNPFVDVLVNGSGPHNFLLDTGSPVTALDRGLAERLGLEVEAAGMASGMGGDSVPAGRVEGVTVRLEGEEAAPEEAWVLPLDSLMSPAADRTVDGVVGYPLFRDRVLDVDFPAGSVRVHQPGPFRYAGSGHRLEMRVIDGWPRVEAVADLPGVGPTPVELMVDVGSRGNVLFTTPFVRRHRVEEFLQDTARATLGLGIGGAGSFLLSHIDGLQLGDLRVPGVVAGFSTGGALPFGQFDGILGTGVLGRYRVILDYTRGEMILEEADGRDGADAPDLVSPP